MGAILALVVLILALLTIFFGLAPHLENYVYWLIVLLALAILLGSTWPVWLHRRGGPPPQ